MAEGGPIWIGLFLVFAALTAKDFFTNAESGKDIPQPKLSRHLMGPPLKFLYCYS